MTREQHSIWKIPGVLAVCTAMALTIALFFEGAADVGSAIVLLLPSIVFAVFLCRARLSR